MSLSTMQGVVRSPSREVESSQRLSSTRQVGKLPLSPQDEREGKQLILVPCSSLFSSYITKSFPFDSSVSNVKEHLKSLYASGGGDGPEGVTAGMKAALELDWRQNAAKMAVLIADAPCHGIGEYGDGFPDRSPDGEDPLLIARQMAQVGIPLVSCKLRSSTLSSELTGAILANRSLLSRVNRHYQVINSD